MKLRIHLIGLMDKYEHEFSKLTQTKKETTDSSDWTD